MPDKYQTDKYSYVKIFQKTFFLYILSYAFRPCCSPSLRLKVWSTRMVNFFANIFLNNNNGNNSQKFYFNTLDILLLNQIYSE